MPASGARSPKVFSQAGNPVPTWRVSTTLRIWRARQFLTNQLSISCCRIVLKGKQFMNGLPPPTGARHAPSHPAVFRVSAAIRFRAATARSARLPVQIPPSR